MKKLFVVITFIALSSCSYESNPEIKDAGFLDGTVETFSGASSIVKLEDVTIETIPKTKTTLTDHQGRYSLEEIPAGDYILKITKESFYDTYAPASIIAGKVLQEDYMLYLYDSNNTPPTIPMYPFPSDSGRSYSTSLQLYWECSDPDSNRIYYDVYFSKEYPPTKCIARQHRENEISVDELEVGERYFWRVCVRDYYGAHVLGNIWTFIVKPIE